MNSDSVFETSRSVKQGRGGRITRREGMSAPRGSHIFGWTCRGQGFVVLVMVRGEEAKDQKAHLVIMDRS